MRNRNMYKQMTTLMFTSLFAATLLADDRSNSGNDSIISDRQQAIYWQDTAIPKKKSTKDWDDATAYCDALMLNGIENWRVPTFNELLSIVDFTRADPAINPVFSHVAEGTYWTATDFSATRSRAWTIDFRTGKTYYSYKTTNHAVRCVADMPEQSKKDKK